MKKRTIPRAMFEPIENVAAEDLVTNEILISLVKKETPLAIREAFDNNKTFATIFEVGVSGYHIDLPKPYWVPALEQCILFLLEDEKFEECVVLKELIQDINSYKPIANKKPKKRKDGAGVDRNTTSNKRDSKS